jgi:peptidyl-prolyl cis-trans isomerase A (cyclophilin A)
MTNSFYRPALLLTSLWLLTACQPAAEQEGAQPTDNAQAAAVQAEIPAPSAAQPAAEAAVADTQLDVTALNHELVPLPGMEAEVPVLTEKTTLIMKTSAGDLVIEVYPQAAPNAAQRFVELAQSGFFDNTPISRVVPDFVAQFGINWREGHKDWQERNFDDDPSLFALERGTLAFAKAGPNTNSTQVFINYAENNNLAAPQYNFTVFGKVVQGMEVVDSFVQVGEPGMGLDQERLWDDGEAYLAEQAVQPSFILSVQAEK